MAALFILAGVAVAEKVERRREKKRSYDNERYAELQRETTRRLSVTRESGDGGNAERMEFSDGDIEAKGGGHRDTVIQGGGMIEGSAVEKEEEEEEKEEAEVQENHDERGRIEEKEDEQRLPRTGTAHDSGSIVTAKEGPVDADKEPIQRHDSAATSEGKGKKRWSKVLKFNKR